MPTTPIISLSSAKGVASIKYAGGHNYVHTNSGVPVLRLVKVAGGNKVYEPLGVPLIGTTNTPGDTFSMSNPRTTLGLLVGVGADCYELDLSITNTDSVDILGWDLKLYSHLFQGQPSWDGTNVWGSTDQGWNEDFPLCMTFVDMGDSLTNPAPWQIWSSDEQPITFHLNPHWNNWGVGNWSDLYFSPDASQPGVYPAFVIPAGTTFSFKLKVAFFLERPDSKVRALSSYSTQSERWPNQLRNDLFPARSLFGFNILAQTPPSGQNWPINNINGWAGDRNLQIYDTDGVLFAQKGDYTGLEQLARKLCGQVRWANHVAADKAKAIGVIHWDEYWAGRWPQPGTSYVGDPTYSAAICPEIWFRDAGYPISIAQQLAVARRQAYDPAASTVPKQLPPSWIVGAALRGSVFSFPPAKQRTYNSLEEGVADLKKKITPLYWAGYRAYYIDSFGPYRTPPQAYAVELLRGVMAAFPDVLLIPEAYRRFDTYSCSRAWHLGTPTGADIAVTWPGNGAMCRMVPGKPTDPGYAKAVATMKAMYEADDCMIGACWSGNPTELEQIAGVWWAIAEGSL